MQPAITFLRDFTSRETQQFPPMVDCFPSRLFSPQIVSFRADLPMSAGCVRPVLLRKSFHKLFDFRCHGQPELFMFASFKVNAIQWAGDDDRGGVQNGALQFIGHTSILDGELS